MKSLPKLLSKTKLLRGYRCSKNIYLTIHEPKLEVPIAPDMQALFDQGNVVGEESRKRFPGGVLIDNKPWDFFGSLKRTRELLAEGVETIYEAAFEHKGCYARADIIQYSAVSQKWKMYEVKSSTKLKPEHIDDIALQSWIMTNAGLDLEEINLLHLNRECIYPNLDNLFHAENITEQVFSSLDHIEPRLNDIFSIIKRSSVPDVDIGSHCLAPNECGFKNHCWQEKSIPELGVFNLPQIKDKKWELYAQGIISLDDTRLSGLTSLQERVVEVFKSKKRHINSDGIKEAVAGWKFPLVFLDFETINPAIPRYDGCGPYKQVPFQFSVHTLDSIDSELKHIEFLHSTKDDPRPSLIPALIQACEGEGSVVAYYGKFESDRIAELIEFSPEHQTKLQAIIDRIVDPLPIIRENVYDNEFRGSFSLKYVAPAILGNEHSYQGMDVADGSAAQRAFEELISEDTSPDRKQELKDGMLAYCKKDTLVMVELVKWLYEQAASVH